jgi:N-acetyl-gamma-glutamyl-phosphate reductase
MKVGIVGASGYSGGELLRLLANHPHFEVAYLAANSQAGESVMAIHPHLTNYGDKKFAAVDITEINKLDLLFTALPHGESQKIIEIINPQIAVVDLGADFRIRSDASWMKYYGGAHAGTWTYGLVDLPGQVAKISDSKRIANPGCYATAISLSAAPLVAADVIDGSDITVVAASGTTGAGRSLKASLLTSESANSLSSYKFGGVHQHTPEIEETLATLSNTEIKISFTPILAPMPRGILATTTAKLNKKMDLAELRKIFSDFYKSSTDIILLEPGYLPATNACLGSNKVFFQLAIDEHTNRVLVSAALDNLTKGAAGQAIQCANLIFNFPINAGLEQQGLGR